MSDRNEVNLETRIRELGRPVGVGGGGRGEAGWSLRFPHACCAVFGRQVVCGEYGRRHD